MGKQNQSQKNREGAESTKDNEAIQEEVRVLAYQLFCECGCAHGHDLDHWVEAERRVLERR